MVIVMSEPTKPRKPRRGIAERRKNDYKKQKSLEKYLRKIWYYWKEHDPERIQRAARKQRDDYTEHPRDPWDLNQSAQPEVIEKKHNGLGNIKKQYNTDHTIPGEEPDPGYSTCESCLSEEEVYLFWGRKLCPECIARAQVKINDGLY